MVLIPHERQLLAGGISKQQQQQQQEEEKKKKKKKIKKMQFMAQFIHVYMEPLFFFGSG